MTSEPSDGFFVTLEGIDGTGKSTVTEEVADIYNRPVVLTSEPSGMKTGDWVYNCIQDAHDQPIRDFYQYMADRAAHIDATIRPALNDDCLVLSDRYADSTRAYQYFALQEAHMAQEPERFIEETMAPWNLTPDLTVLLDAPVDVALSRAEGGDQYEKADFLGDVRERYLELAERSDRIVRVDVSTRTVDETVDRVLELIHTNRP